MKKYIVLYTYCLWLFFTTIDCLDNNFAQALHSYMWANYNTFNGKKYNAYEWYNNVFAHKQSGHGYKGYIHLLFESNHYKTIVQLMNIVPHTFLNDPIIQRIFAISLQQTGYTAQSDALFMKLNKEFPNDNEIAFHTINSYLRLQKYPNALAIIDSIIKVSEHKPYEFIFHYLKAQTYFQMNNKKDAKKYIKNTLKMNSQFDKGWLLFALLLEYEHNFTEAINAFNTYLHLTKSPQKEIEQHLLDLIIKHKNKHIKKAWRFSSFPLFYNNEYYTYLPTTNHCLLPFTPLLQTPFKST